MTWIQATSEGVVLHLKIQPKASKTEVVGPFGNPPRLKVRVAAQPRDNQANEELLFFLKKRLKITQSDLSIIRGETNTNKDILCRGLTLDEVQQKLGLSTY